MMYLNEETKSVNATVLGAPSRFITILATKYITMVPIPPILRAAPVTRFNSFNLHIVNLYEQLTEMSPNNVLDA
jgi:hypothetical protein